MGATVKGWTLLKLAEVIRSITGGISINAADRPAVNGERGILTLSAVSYGSFDPTANKAILDSDERSLGQTVRAGTILMSRSNTLELVGACVFVDRDYPRLHLPDLLWELSINDSHVDPEWLHYNLMSPLPRKQIQNRATGTSESMKKISMSSLRGIEIYCPPVSEQKSITSVLSTWDRGIRQLTDLITTKLRFKQGLMQQLLTGQRRFKELGNDAWNEHHLGDLFTEREETNCVDLPLLSITADRGVIPRTDVDRKDTSNENKSLYKRIAPGDIGYNTMRMWQGVSAVSRYEGIVSPAYTICIPGPEIDADFAGYLFKYPPVVHLFYRFSQGLVDDTLNLKFHHFAQIRVRIPSVKEQRRIAQVFSKCDEEIEVLRKQLDALKQQKKGLMQKLLTGEVRVKL